MRYSKEARSKVLAAIKEIFRSVGDIIYLHKRLANDCEQHVVGQTSNKRTALFNRGLECTGFVGARRIDDPRLPALNLDEGIAQGPFDGNALIVLQRVAIHT